MYGQAGGGGGEGINLVSRQVMAGGGMPLKFGIGLLPSKLTC